MSSKQRQAKNSAGAATTKQRPPPQGQDSGPHELEINQGFDACTIWGLAILIADCWSSQFEPLHGMSWQDPTWWHWLKFGLLGIGPLFTLYIRREAEWTRNLAMVTYIALAWAQTIQHFLGFHLHPVQAHLFELLFSRGVVGFAHGHLLALASSLMQRQKHPRDGNFAIELFTLPTYVVMMLAVLGARAKLISRFTNMLPYWLLPSSFVAPFLLTAVSVALALSKLRSARRVQGASRALLTILALLPVIHGIFFNTRSPLPIAKSRLDSVLAHEGFSLLARGDGRATGYVSVMQNNKDGFRVMRCGHSLLGGVWLHGGGLVKEPVYVVFVMLEAVRLIETIGVDKKLPLASVDPVDMPDVLVIGLGIGTAPAAFIHHGMNTTIVEVDRIVYDYAIQYFDLPLRHNAVIGDAVSWVAEAGRPASNEHKDERSQSGEKSAISIKQYDYIVHDVFTGGVEPSQLFTVEFLTGLKDLLKDNGSIAINYAGDLELPPPNLVLRTILAVFPSCRIYRDIEPQSDGASGDLINIVVFCRKQRGAFRFREPIEADFLSTQSRRHTLPPTFEMDQTPFNPKCAKRGDCNTISFARDNDLLWADNVSVLDRWQAEAGRRHWMLMRGVIPPRVWDNW